MPKINLNPNCEHCGADLADSLAERPTVLAEWRARCKSSPVELVVPESAMLMFGIVGLPNLLHYVECGVLPEPVTIAAPGRRALRRFVLSELVAAADRLIADRNSRVAERVEVSSNTTSRGAK